MPDYEDFLERTEQDKSVSPQKYKEAMSSFVKRHIGDFQAVYGQFSKNPFLMKRPTKINSVKVMPRCVVEDMGKQFPIGILHFHNITIQFQFNFFTVRSTFMLNIPKLNIRTFDVLQDTSNKTTRLIFGEKDVINIKITKNLLKLPKDADKHLFVILL